MKEFGSDKRQRLLPSPESSANMIGYLEAVFEYTDINNIVMERKMGGTASLHHRMSGNRFIIRTTAHNLV